MRYGKKVDIIKEIESDPKWDDIFSWGRKEWKLMDCVLKNDLGMKWLERRYCIMKYKKIIKRIKRNEGS